MVMQPALLAPSSAPPAHASQRALPPGSANHADDASIYDASRLDGELPASVALPPLAQEQPVPAASLLPPEASSVSAAAPLPLQHAAPLRLSTAPPAALVAKRRDKSSGMFLFLTVATCVALLVLVGAAYLRLADRATPSPVIDDEADEPPPPRVVRRPRSRSPQPVTEPRRQQPDGEPAPLAIEPLPPLVADIPAMRSVSSEDSSPASPSTPFAAPPEPPPPPQVSRAEVQQLIKAFETAKTALAEQDFSLADAQLATADSLAKLPAQQAAAARLKEVRGYVQQFHEAVAAAVGGMKAGESFKVGASTQVSFVEGDSQRVILRVAGMNKTYKLNDLPPGLALALVDFKLPPADAQTKVIKGAYLLVHQRADSETQSKARQLWEEASAAGQDTSHLQRLLTENYADFLKDAAD
jgi:hypothetical protein